MGFQNPYEKSHKTGLVAVLIAVLLFIGLGIVIGWVVWG